MSQMHVLFETASGYGMFEVQEAEGRARLSRGQRDLRRPTLDKSIVADKGDKGAAKAGARLVAGR